MASPHLEDHNLRCVMMGAILMSRTQITREPEMQRRARRGTSELGIFLAECIRCLVADDLGGAKTAAAPVVFAVGSSGGSEIAREKRALRQGPSRRPSAISCLSRHRRPDRHVRSSQGNRYRHAIFHRGRVRASLVCTGWALTHAAAHSLAPQLPYEPSRKTMRSLPRRYAAAPWSRTGKP